MSDLCSNCTIECERMPECTVCGMPKKPSGRSAPLEAAMTDEEAEREAWECLKDTLLIARRELHRAGFRAGLARTRKQADQCIKDLDETITTMAKRTAALERVAAGDAAASISSEREHSRQVTSAADSTSAMADYSLSEVDLAELSDGANSVIAETMQREGFLTRAGLARIARAAGKQLGVGFGSYILNFLADASEENDEAGD